MIASWIRSVRVFLPPSWILVIALLIYAGFESLYAFLRLSWQLPREDCVKFLEGRDHLFIFAVSCLGFFRVVAFLPLFYQPYYDWLRRTPWTLSKPLPLGPVWVTPQDVFVLALVRLLLHDYQLHEALLPLAFMASSTAAIAAACWVTTPRIVAYVLAWLLGLVLLLSYSSLWYGLAAATVAYLLAVHGVRTSLAAFPWPQEMSQWKSFKRTQIPSRDGSFVELGPNQLGWPTNMLHPQLPPSMVGIRDYVWLSLLSGWTFFAVLIGPNQLDSEHHLPRAFSVLIGIFCIAGRLAHYCENFWPPISFAGRIRTGRLIIPGYDKVFIAPAMTLFVLVASRNFLVFYRHDHFLSVTIAATSVAVMLLVTFLIGPSRQAWRLTGRHRIWRGLVNRREFGEL
jgi:hypothetical protein